jgi:hypothetical protein
VCKEGLCLGGGASSTYIVRCDHVCLVVSPPNDSGQSTGTGLNFRVEDFAGPLSSLISPSSLLGSSTFAVMSHYLVVGIFGQRLCSIVQW